MMQAIENLGSQAHQDKLIADADKSLRTGGRPLNSREIALLATAGINGLAAVIGVAIKTIRDQQKRIDALEQRLQGGS